MSPHFYRSLWGLEALGLDASVKAVKAAGFHGVEASLGDMGYQNSTPRDFSKVMAFKNLCIELDLKVVAGVYSSWQDYEGPWEKKSVSQHLSQLEFQFQAVSVLSGVVTHINIHSGSDDFSDSESREYFGEATKLQERYTLPFVEFGHETHRGRILYSPWTTRELLRDFPNLQLTLDLSHWIVVCERLLETDYEWTWLQSQVIPRVAHVHARVGHAQAPQVSTTDDPAFASEVAYFDRVWKSVHQHRQSQGLDSTLCLEYGPYPYQPKGALDVPDISNLIISELTRLRSAMTL